MNSLSRWGGGLRNSLLSLEATGTHKIYWMALQQGADEWAQGLSPSAFDQYLKDLAKQEAEEEAGNGEN